MFPKKKKIFPACFLCTETGSTREVLAPVQLLDFSVAEVLGASGWKGEGLGPFWEARGAQPGFLL